MSAHENLGALPVAAVGVLESLYEHRLLSSRQLHRMHTPDASMRWTREVLTGLRRRGLVDFLRAADGGGSVYFLTTKGADAVELVPTRAQTRRKLITPAQAAGPLRAHTLAVNETGIAFITSARERGDEFGTLAWRHEIAHPTGPRRGELLIADALFTYLRYGPDGELIFHYRLLEARPRDPAHRHACGQARPLRPPVPLYARRSEVARLAGALSGVPRCYLCTRRPV